MPIKLGRDVFALIDRDDRTRLGFFQTRLSIKQIRQCERKADKIWKETEQYKTVLFEELCKKLDKKFTWIQIKEIEI